MLLGNGKASVLTICIGSCTCMICCITCFIYTSSSSYICARAGACILMPRAPLSYLVDMELQSSTVYRVTVWCIPIRNSGKSAFTLGGLVEFCSYRLRFTGRSSGTNTECDCQAHLCRRYTVLTARQGTVTDIRQGRKHLILAFGRRSSLPDRSDGKPSANSSCWRTS